MKLPSTLLTLMASAVTMAAPGRLTERRLPDHYIIGKNMDGLPECYKECMIEKANVVKGLPILNLNVHDFCDMPNWLRVGSWVDWHYFPCLDKKCPWPRDDSERESARWFKNTCGWSG